MLCNAILYFAKSLIERPKFSQMFIHAYAMLDLIARTVLQEQVQDVLQDQEVKGLKPLKKPGAA